MKLTDLERIVVDRFPQWKWIVLYMKAKRQRAAAVKVLLRSANLLDHVQDALVSVSMELGCDDPEISSFLTKQSDAIDRFMTRLDAWAAKEDGVSPLPHWEERAVPRMRHSSIRIGRAANADLESLHAD